VCVCVCVCVCAHHIFLIHLSVVGHLGCFHDLDIVNNIAIILVFKCLYGILTYITWIYTQDTRSGLARSYGNFIFSFLITLILFSIMAVLIYIPTNSVYGFLFPHILANICCYLCSS
jgi:hypothetical protein